MGSTRREFVGSTLLTAAAARAAGASKVSRPLPRTKIKALDYEGVTLLDGFLLEQYKRTRDFYLNLPNDDILKGFRKLAGMPAPGSDMGGWAEHDTSTTFGQWLSGMARMYKATGDVSMRDKALYLMTEWGKTIRPNQCPYYAFDNKPVTSHYPFEKTVCGLVDINRYAGDSGALNLLERLTDWGMKSLDRSCLPATPKDPSGPSTHGIEWYTLSENLYQAYLLTGDSKYKSFASVWHYPQYWNRFNNLQTIDIHGLHAYSHVNTLSSAAMSYAITGDDRLLAALENAYRYFIDTQTYATGGYGPAEHLMSADGSLGRSLETQGNTFETPCGSWAVFKLCRYLMEFTADARYGDWIESLVYNGIGAALPMADRTDPGGQDIWTINGWNGGVPRPTRGRTFYYADYRLGGARKNYFYANWPCCSGTYIQDVVDYHNLIYYRDEHSIFVNLYVPSELRTSVNGRELRLTQETRYPESEVSTFTLHSATLVSVAIHFRVPSWAVNGLSVHVNGQPVNVKTAPGTWARLEREWKPGDRVSVRIPTSVRKVPIDRQHSHRAAFAYGPLVLAQLEDERIHPDSVIRSGTGLDFSARPVSPGKLIPFYQVKAEQPYSVYFDFV